MKKVIPKSKTKLLQKRFLDFRLEEAFVSSSMIKNITSPLYKSYSVTFEYQITNSTIEPWILQIVPRSNPAFQFDVLELTKSPNVCFLVHHA